MDTEATERLQDHTILDGKYEIMSFIGSGGMGSVYRARHIEIGSDVAIKMLHPRFTADPDSVKRFQREAHIISALRHNSILAVYAFGASNGMLYIAMELVEGRSLGSIIEESGPLHWKQLIPLATQICDAMVYAHQNSILHRDFKPQNAIVITSPDGIQTVKVVDFGLAKLQDGSDIQKLTRTGEVVDDPNYMSPEQCQGRPLDERSDIYSFGCLLYEALTGQQPFWADSPMATLFRQVSEEPKRFAEPYAVPAALEAITLTAMAKNADNRYESFTAVKNALLQFAQNPDIKMHAPVSTRKTFMLSGRVAVIYVVIIGCLFMLIGTSAVSWYSSKKDSEAESEILSIAKERLRGYQNKLRLKKDASKKDSKLAIQYAEQLGDHNAVAEATLELSKSYAEDDDVEKAYEVAKGLINLPKLSPEMRALVKHTAAYRAYLCGRYAEAEPVIEETALYEERTPTRFTEERLVEVLTLADIKSRLQQPQAAAKLLDTLDKEIPIVSDGHLNPLINSKAEVLIGNRLKERAEKLTQQILDAPVPPDKKLIALTNISAAYAIYGDTKQSQEVNEQIVLLASNSTKAMKAAGADKVLALFKNYQSGDIDQVIKDGEPLEAVLEKKNGCAGPGASGQPATQTHWLARERQKSREAFSQDSTSVYTMPSAISKNRLL